MTGESLVYPPSTRKDLAFIEAHCTGLGEDCEVRKTETVDEMRYGDINWIMNNPDAF